MMAKKKVLFLFHDSVRNNGANHSMMDIIDFLTDNNKIVPYIAFPKKSGSAIDYAKNKGYKVFTIRYGRWDFPDSLHGKEKIIYAIKWTIKLASTIGAFLYLKKQIKKENINIIYTNTFSIFLGAWLKKSCKIPHIWHIREFGKEDHNLRIVFGERKLYKYLNEYTDSIIFISHSICNKYLPHIIDKSKCHVLYNDILPIQYDLSDKWYKPTVFNILIAGTISEGKGQFDVVRAVKNLVINSGIKNIKLFIAGEVKGEYAKKIVDYVKANDLNKYIEFCGFVTNMVSIRQKCQIGVVASSNEAFGRVTVEGMMAGMVMIGANAAGTAELIENGETGYLYNLHDVKQLSNIIKNCITYPDIAKVIAKNGYSYAINQFGNNRTCKELAAIIEKL